jgi:hypothetical protein
MGCIEAVVSLYVYSWSLLTSLSLYCCLMCVYTACAIIAIIAIEVRISDPDQYQAIVDAEWDIIYSKLDSCVATGAQIILSKLPIGKSNCTYYIIKRTFSSASTVCCCSEHFS